MKRFFVALAAFGLAAAVATAQDFKKAVETFNAGATTLETNKTEALAQFRAAMAEAALCEGEEAAELVAKCKEIIPGTLMSIAKEQINEANYDSALATLAEVKTVVQLLQHNKLCTLFCHIGNVTGQLLLILFDVCRTALLYDSYFHSFCLF